MRVATQENKKTFKKVFQWCLVQFVSKRKNARLFKWLCKQCLLMKAVEIPSAGINKTKEF